jgi:putative sterol carrier protein
MSFRLSDFKSNLTGGGARSSLFNVNITFPTAISQVASTLTGGVPGSAGQGQPINISAESKMKFLVQSASLPASTLGTYDIYYHGKALKVATDRTFEGWSTTIINDEDFVIRNDLEKWINLISKPDLNTRDTAMVGTDKFEGTNADYKSTATVTQFSRGGSSLKTYKFLGIFPISIAAIPLDWNNAAIETYDCGWTYDSWEIV